VIEGTRTNPTVTEEAELRTVIDQWVKAIRDEDRAGIRANHDPNILMFDVPPPFSSCGLDAYMATWDMFFAWQAKPVQFDLHDMAISAGKDVAFATATGQCCDLSSGEKVDLRFRLTMGFCKHNGRWWIVHEHHSLPALS
jgi:ketosteroid isomerase-like protein